MDLHDAGFGTDPLTDPLTYPGRPITSSLLLVDREVLPLDAEAVDHLGDGRVDVRTSTVRTWRDAGQPELSLDDALAAVDATPIPERVASVAVGSNASPAQMARKFAAHGVSSVLPMVVADVTGVAIGFAAHVAAAGYVPTAPLPDPGGAARPLALLLLDHDQLAALDATEPNYRRAVLDPTATTVTLPSGEVLRSVAAYVAERGIVGVDGDPWPYPRTQEQLVAGLVERAPRLVDLVGGIDAEAFTSRCRADVELRETVRDALVDADLVCHPVAPVTGEATPDAYGCAAPTTADRTGVTRDVTDVDG